MEIDRIDGRTPNQLRPLTCSRNVFNRAHGSASWSQGDTKVLAAVYGPKAGTKKNENPEKTCIEVIWKPKTGQTGKSEREYEMILKRTLQSICILTVNPNTTTSVIIQVVNDDGALLPCSINAACAALVDAGVPLKHLAVAICCGLAESGYVILDPAKLEEQKMKAFAYFVFPNSVLSVLPEGSPKVEGEPMENGIITSVTQGAMAGGICNPNSQSDLEEERRANQRKIDMLEEELASLKEEAQKHTIGLQNGEREMVQSEAETELQEALDALSTLDKALLESQAERERLLKQLNELKKSSTEDQENVRKDLANLQGEFDRLKVERDELRQKRERIEEEHEVLGRLSSDGPTGRPGQALRCDSPSMASISQRSRLLSNSKPPPPTPPPSMPPPPLPISLPGLPNNSPLSNVAPPSSAATVRRPTRTSNSSSQLSHTNNSNSGRESPSTSVGTNSLIDSISLDPRVLKKIEEQESAISKLSKQLSHCEADLKANIDLVANLESALNDTERNLRKSRLQMNELAKERDQMSVQNEKLRRELSAANLEVEKVRTNVMAEKVLFENQLGEERRAKENAKKQLESRMEEMQNSRMNRKSKFNCF